MKLKLKLKLMWRDASGLGASESENTHTSARPCAVACAAARTRPVPVDDAGWTLASAMTRAKARASGDVHAYASVGEKSAHIRNDGTRAPEWEKQVWHWFGEASYRFARTVRCVDIV